MAKTIREDLGSSSDAKENYWRQFVSFNLPKRKTLDDGGNDGCLGRKTFLRSVSGEPGAGVVAEEPFASSKGGKHVTAEFSLQYFESSKPNVCMLVLFTRRLKLV